MENKWTSTPIPTSEPPYCIKNLEKNLHIIPQLCMFGDWTWKLFFSQQTLRSSVPKDSSNDNQLYTNPRRIWWMIVLWKYSTLFSYSANFFWLTLCIPKKTWKKVVGFHLFKIDKGGDRHISFLKPLISTWKDNDLYAEKRAGKKYILLAKASTSQNLFRKVIPDHITLSF